MIETFARTPKTMNSTDLKIQKIGQEIHDGLCQTLTVTAMNLIIIRKEQKLLSAHRQILLAETIELIDKAIRESKSISHAMMSE